MEALRLSTAPLLSEVRHYAKNPTNHLFAGSGAQEWRSLLSLAGVAMSMSHPTDGPDANGSGLARNILDGVGEPDAALLAALPRRQLAAQHRARQALLEHANALLAPVPGQESSTVSERQTAMIALLRDITQGLLDNTTRAIDNDNGQNRHEDYHYKL
ncbi:hypothetical protein R8Z50_22650 [Longispora sp. K20-0274]|uniref:hypothetical protein n=1 Tax=Longispora sp. K20-0274 TaxID=3088255 RepID=UPI0039994909